MDKQMTVDFAKLGRATQHMMRNRLITAKDAADEIGVTPATMHRALHGYPLDFDNVMRVCRWLRLPCSYFLPNPAPNITSPRDTLQAIVQLINNDPAIPKQNKAPFVEMFTVAYEYLRKGE